MRSRSWLALAAFVVAVPGILRDVSVVFWKQGRLVTSRTGSRFEWIAGRVPPEERLGFLTDEPSDPSGRYFDALYALAPRILSPGAGHRHVVADVSDPAQVEALAARWGLRVVARGAPGVALLERE